MAAQNFKIKNGLTVGTTEVIDSSGDLTNAAFGTAALEAIDDQVNSLLTAGTGVSLSYDDAAGTLTINGQVGDIQGVTAGDGLSGGGTSGTVSVALDLNELTGAAVAVDADSIAIIDGSDSNASRKESIADLVSAIAGTGLTASSGQLSLTDTGYVTGVTAGDGLSGGGTDGTVTVALDLNELTAAAVDVSADSIAIIDAGDSSSKKESIADLATGMAGTNISASAGTLGIADSVIRGKFSAGGDLSYNSSTGVFSFTNDAGDIEGVTAGDGLSGGGSSGTVTLAIDANELTAATVDPAADSVLIIDASDSNASRKEAIADIATMQAGDGLTASSGAFNVNVDDSSIETSSDALQVKALGVTNAMLAGSIANAKLANSTITIAGASTALGGTVLADTDALSEGSSNLYYTDERNDDRTATLITAGSGITKTYDDAAGTLTIASSITQYADANARQAISVTDNGGDGSLAYNNSTGVITYAGPSASEVRAHITAGTGVSISSGEVSIGQAVATSSNVQFANLTLSGDLTVNGTTSTVSSTNTTISDALIELGNGTSGSPSNDSGFVIERGDSDNVFIGWDESADVVTVGTGSFTGASTGNLTHTVANFTAGVGTFSSLDISGNADIDGTLEADAFTVDGTALNEYIADTVGAMVSGNTETGITVSYEDGDNTLDFVVGTLNQDTTGTADNFTVTANNSTDETVYPVFVDGATGSQGAETDTGFTYNPNSGVITATQFTGNVTGTLTGTATGLAGTPNISVGTIASGAHTITNATNAGGTSRNIYQSTSAPSGSDGAVGDLWILYS